MLDKKWIRKAERIQFVCIAAVVLSESIVTDVILWNNTSWRIIWKMAILGNFVFLQKFTGLDPQGGRRNIITRIFCSVLFLLFYLLTSIFIALNYRETIDDALYDVSIMNGNSAFVLSYYYLLINREQFYSLLGDLEDILYKSVFFLLQWRQFAVSFIVICYSYFRNSKCRNEQKLRKSCTTNWFCHENLHQRTIFSYNIVFNSVHSGFFPFLHWKIFNRFVVFLLSTLVSVSQAIPPNEIFYIFSLV